MSENEFKIFVLTNGWVLVGNILDVHDGYYYLKDSSVIRRWGTTAGLGELAFNGKNSETKLDFYGNVRIMKANIIFVIECKNSKWIN